MSTVSEIASQGDLVSISADHGRTAYDVAVLMKDNRVGSVIIVDRQGNPLGIITERDMIKRVCLENIAPSRIALEDIMSSPLITIMSYDSIDTASRLMTKNKLKHLVVLEADNRIAGMLSVSDITRHLARILLDDYKRYRSLGFALDLC